VSDRTWPAFVTADLGDGLEADAEMQRRWEAYEREMRALVAAGGVHQDAEGWWIDDATGELIGPDPEIERPLTEAELAAARPFAEVFPDLAASIRDAKAELVTLRLDPDLVAAYKADGGDWRSRINADLRKAKRLPAAAGG
jgi:uncharacterized protein (DUF4415 family)